MRLVPGALACLLALTACGQVDARSTPTRTATTPSATPVTPSATPVTTPATPVKGSDDVNGDGFADLAMFDGSPDDPRFVVVYGSAHGLAPATATVVTPWNIIYWFPEAVPTLDLDADGYADIPLSGGTPARPYISWGGKRGAGKPVPMWVPDGTDPERANVTPGDFNADGVGDVAMSATAPNSDKGRLAVLYGPFTRDGRPARHTVQPSPTGAEFWRMTADAKGHDLLVHRADDGEQEAPYLLKGGKDGLATQGTLLNEGLAVAFGDFDGDGSREPVVADDGSRNDEPGYETEEPEVDGVLTVYGQDRQTVRTGMRGRLAAGDLDGDGRDDLAFGGYAWWDYKARPPRVLWGGRNGLRQGEDLTALGPSSPLAAGDYNGDGRDELVLSTAKQGVFQVSDGRKLLNSFELPS
ncbi:FG-GAP repeat domain-containing protein [Nonomuraea sp. NPDC050556]|uniref:FG-GAP repeat domain-containing protein n=1 Tax=Nonomuraea sp. NPDC050556 TaxID=3364369 RepID=UPI00378EA885